MIHFEGRDVPSDLREIVNPSHTVLVVWDMQNDQAGGAFNKEELIRKTPLLIDAAHKAQVQVVYTQSTPYLWRDESPAWIRRAMKEQMVDQPEKLKPRRARGSFGWQLMEPFKAGETDLVLEKRRPTIFLGTEFESMLLNRRTTTIIIAGCTTEGGIEGTVRDGFNRGYFMVVGRDCVGTYREENHLAALKRMERFADLVQSHELIKAWRLSR